MKFLTSIAFVFLCATAWAQLTPDAPIANFRLPMFGENGYRAWELSGREGRYLSAEKIEVADMRLKIFSGDEKSILEHIIESPSAMLFVSKNMAIGESPIKISSTNYRIEGERWFWDGKTRSVVVSHNAKVTFFQDL